MELSLITCSVSEFRNCNYCCLRNVSLLPEWHPSSEVFFGKLCYCNMFMSLFICFKHLSRSLQVHHMQWKDRTSLLSGPTLLMVQLAFHNSPLLVVEISHLLDRNLALMSKLNRLNSPYLFKQFFAQNNSFCTYSSWTVVFCTFLFKTYSLSMGCSLCTMADFQNCLISRVFGVFQETFCTEKL